MIKISDLNGIDVDKRVKSIKLLDELLTFKDERGKLAPLISGYNWYIDAISSEERFVFSNMHDSEGYKQAMLNDLEKYEYNTAALKRCIIQRSGTFLWDPVYNLRNERGDIFDIKIKDLRSNAYISIEDYNESLSLYKKFVNSHGHLIAECSGWEINIPFKSKKELTNLIELFLKKSGRYIYDEQGYAIKETKEEISSRSPWADAYKVPVLIISKAALKYAKEWPYFDIATKMALTENNNEISFIIHKNFQKLKKLPHYIELKNIGFTEEMCLCNKPFLNFINKTFP